MAEHGEGTDAAAVRMVCARCGSHEVTREAWAEWDECAQQWRLGAMFERGWCHRCERAARIAERAG